MMIFDSVAQALKSRMMEADDKPNGSSHSDGRR